MVAHTIHINGLDGAKRCSADGDAAKALRLLAEAKHAAEKGWVVAGELVREALRAVTALERDWPEAQAAERYVERAARLAWGWDVHPEARRWIAGNLELGMRAVERIVNRLPGTQADDSVYCVRTLIHRSN